MSSSTFAAIFNFANGISVGAGQTNRTSDTIWLRSLELKFRLAYTFTASAFAQDFIQIIRYTVLKWIPNTALVLPTPGSIFQNVTTAGLFANFDFELKDMYKIYMDNFVKISAFADSGSGFAQPNPDSTHVIIKNINLLDSRLDFTPSAITGSGLVYLALTSDSNTGPQPTIYGVARLYYYNDSA